MSIDDKQEWADTTWMGAQYQPPPRFAGWLSERLPHHTGRHIGLGKPLQGTSWLNRPHFAGYFVGGWFGDELVANRIDQRDGLFAGFWLGYELGHYWGAEFRFSYSYIPIDYLPEGIAGGSTRNVLADAHLLYYPWGDSRWRPYGSIGMGLAGFHFVDRPNTAINHTHLDLPLGIGVKYQWHRDFAFRLDIHDNLVFGGGQVKMTNNWSVVGGVEWHWGSGSSARYLPW